MDNKAVFNSTICIIGIAILLIRSVSLIFKKDRRKDQNSLLSFILFTAIHLGTYLTFTLVKLKYTSDNLIMGFYTTFYIMNNVELLLFFIYAVSHITARKKALSIIKIVNYSLFAVFVILDIVNIFTNFFFKADNGMYVREKYMILSQGYQFFAFILVFILTIIDKNLGIIEKTAFSLYCLLPLVAIIVQNAFPGYAVAYLSIVISIELLFLYVNIRKDNELAHEAKRNKEAEIRIMMSQIQPHFIYNTLSSISTLIKTDPEKAQKGLDDFTEYLRTNLSSLSETGLISFDDELKHIETYLALEKMRFDDRLIVNYDIRVSDFMLPPLSIQPLVENAVKHGILQKIEGGTVNIRTFENNVAYVVIISDDGVGFDPKSIDTESNKHIGLNNVRYRISTLCKGTMRIDSEIDKGTIVTVLFYKQ